MKPEEIKAFVEANPKLVTRRESERYPGLYVIKYTRKVFYDSLWTPELMEMRGLVVDKDYNIVIYPFTKIFNRGENGIDIDPNWTKPVRAVAKVNGFLGCVTIVEGYGKVYSTTGSLDSEFADLTKKHLEHIPIQPGHTYMFEICDPSDPHIIEQEHGAHFIGLRRLKTGIMYPEEDLDDLVIGWNEEIVERNFLVWRPWTYKEPFSTILELAKNARHEGFVVHGPLNNGEWGSIKIKSPYYLTTKFLARMKKEKFLEKIENPQELKKTIDEEFYDLIDFLHQKRYEVAELDEQKRIELVRNFFGVGQWW